MPGKGPRGRRDGLVVEALGDETLIYDVDRHEAHCLNRTAALVWSACDGERDAGAIARHLAREVPGASPALVEMALVRLARARLLEAAPATLPRRAALRRLSLAAALLPVVASIVVPEPAQAASCSALGNCCAAHTDCCPGLHCTGLQNVPPCTVAPRIKRCF